MSKRPWVRFQVGQRFGRLVISELQARHAVCVCDCGRTCAPQKCSLRAGRTASCGCLQKELAVTQFSIHGKYSSTTYSSWQHMRSRCNNPSDSNYHKYGGRGISICPEWDDFQVFLADMGERPKSLSLDRIDVNGNYCKSNCRWATAKEQGNNRRYRFSWCVHGRTFDTLADAAAEHGVSRQTIKNWCGGLFGRDGCSVIKNF